MEGGVEFVSALIDRLRYNDDVKHMAVRDVMNERLKYQWTTDRGRPEMLIKTKIGLSFSVDQTLGEKMGWLKKNQVGNIIMGPNALATFREEDDGTWNFQRDPAFGTGLFNLT